MTNNFLSQLLAFFVGMAFGFILQTILMLLLIKKFEGLSDKTSGKKLDKQQVLYKKKEEKNENSKGSNVNIVDINIKQSPNTSSESNKIDVSNLFK